MITLGRDIKGNKIARYSPRNGERGFSVQTLDNMPNTHRCLAMNAVDELVARIELTEHVKKYGTPRQKKLLGLEAP